MKGQLSPKYVEYLNQRYGSKISRKRGKKSIILKWWCQFAV